MRLLTHKETTRWAVALCLSMISVEAFGKTIYVWQGGAHVSPYGSWANAATNITAAVAVAAANDTIIVTNGTYTEPAVITLNRNGLRMVSVNGPQVTIINGRGTIRVSRVIAQNVRIEGFTLTNGYVSGNGAGLLSGVRGLLVSNCIISGNVTAGNTREGAGIRATANPTIVDCVIVGNRHMGTGGNGGGVYIAGGSLARCVISGNEATRRGGGVYAVTTAPVIQNCVFENNVQAVATGAGNGGGALYFEIAGTARGCTFNNNSAEANGGAVYVNNVAAQVIGCRFRGNHTQVAGAGYGGGAVYAGNSARVRECAFRKNVSVVDGGGVMMNGGALVNCVFDGNTAADRGGGVMVSTLGAITNCLFYNNSADEGGAVYANATTRAAVHSCTFVRNTALTGAGGIDCYQNVFVYNSIAYDNIAPVYTNYRHQGTAARWRYSCTWPALSSPYDNGGNITNAPLFLLAEEHYYHPATNSPVVNAGSNEAWMAAAVELTPQPRIIGGRVDMGAHELGRLVCAFKGTPRAGAAPLTVNFSSYVTGTNTAGLAYYWDFDAPNGATTNGLGLSAPSWTYTNDGIYSVSLVVSNAAGEHAACLRENYIYVISTPRYVATNGPHISPFTSWATAASNIESAVAISYDYTPIYVSDGVYRISASIVLTNAVRLMSVSGPERTTIDGMGMTRCLRISADAMVQGFGISNGAALGGGLNGCGGGALLQGAGLMSNCYFYRSQARMGGGAALHNGGWLYGCMFVSNQAQYGGGVHVFGPGVVQNGVLRENYASDRGGGAFGDAASIIRNCLLFGNAAGTNGGGIAIQNSGSRVESCTVASNRAYRGGGVYSRSGGAYYNTISYFNTATIAAQSNWHSEVIGTDYGRSFWHCDTAPVAGLPNQTGCISDDPRFRDMGAWSFRLQGNSACINTGMYQGWMAGATDLDGAPRVREGRVDIGAYESVMAWLKITNTTDGTRMPFRVLHHTVAGESGGLVGMMTFSNRWSDGYTEGVGLGTTPATSVWDVLLHLPHYGRYDFSIYGTNEYGDVLSDEVWFERARHKTHFIRRW